MFNSTTSRGGDPAAYTYTASVLTWSLFAGFATAAFVLDLILPRGVLGGAPYLALLFFDNLPVGRLQRHRRFVLAAIATMLTGLGYFLSVPGEVQWMVLSNRSFTLFAIWSGTLLLRAHDAAKTEQDKTNTKLRAVLLASLDPLIAADDHGRIQFASSSVEQVFGYRAGDLIGKNVDMLLAEPYASQHDEYLRRYRHSGVARLIGSSREYAAKRRSGEEFPCEVSLSKVDPASGEPTLFVATVRDISERQETESQLRRSEERLREAYRIARMGVWEWNIREDKLYYSGHIPQIHGARENEQGVTLRTY